MKRTVFFALVITSIILLSHVLPIYAMEKLHSRATYTQVKERTDELFNRLRRLSTTELDSVKRDVVAEYLIPSEREYALGHAAYLLSYYMVSLVQAEHGDVSWQLWAAHKKGGAGTGADSHEKYLELCNVAELEKKTGKSWPWGAFRIEMNEHLKDTWEHIKKTSDLELLRDAEKWYGIALKNPKANYKHKVEALLGLASLKTTRATSWEDGTLSNEGELKRSITLLNEAKQLALQAQQIARQNKDRQLYNSAGQEIRYAEECIKKEIKQRKQQDIEQRAIKKFLQ